MARSVADSSQLVVPLFTDIKPQGGGTFIAPDSIGKIAGYLAEHPEGVMPTGFDFRGIRDSCTQFVELTGNIGDVSDYTSADCHASPQSLQQGSCWTIRARLTTPGRPDAPFHAALQVAQLDPHPADDHQPARIPVGASLVELKTLKELGRDPLNGDGGLDFQIAHAREGVVPKRLEKQGKWKVEMEERMRVRQLQLAQQQQHQQTQVQTTAQAPSQAQGVVA
jgi:hypothetical protein